ncbi:MAG TPA: UDP-N-acetylglucosamine 2-epimerase (non-hydrolyzing) [Cyclobacteriaceae bacterium]|nr:UDP-N-acetylglucosamine 2-epimerase (non-hydrolyzing) [Cyclobacteriaceae bacterium]
MKVLTVIGARPQFIKAAAVSRALKAAGIPEIIVHTGQHYDHNMSEVFFKEMDIPAPDHNLGINDVGHGAMTGRMLEKIEAILLEQKPGYVLVYGDTNSTLAGALAAVKLHIPVAHVEAGLRSFDMNMPEEVNRILTDRISNILFCPTQAAIGNLDKEGFKTFNTEILNVGDVMLDTLLFYKQRASQKSTVVKDLGLAGKDFVLATIHRAENTNNIERLKGICEAINEINKKIPVVLPLHPRTKGYLNANNIMLEAQVTEPLGYFDMLSVLSSCKLVMTDSGGLQKESYFCGKFCVTLRDQTEWVELIDAGANVLAGASKKTIVDSVFSNLTTKVSFDPKLYGDGHAAEKIAARLKT